MIKLYGVALSNNVNKVRYCLDYLKLPYEFVQLNPMKGENRTTEYLDLCPTGKIPAMELQPDVCKCRLQVDTDLGVQ